MYHGTSYRPMQYFQHLSFCSCSYVLLLYFDCFSGTWCRWLGCWLGTNPFSCQRKGMEFVLIVMLKICHSKGWKMCSLNRFFVDYHGINLFFIPLRRSVVGRSWLLDQPIHPLWSCFVQPLLFSKVLFTLLWQVIWVEPPIISTSHRQTHKPWTL